MPKQFFILQETDETLRNVNAEKGLHLVLSYAHFSRLAQKVKRTTIQDQVVNWENQQ